MQAIKTVKNELGELDGITTFCEMAVPLSSRLAEVLGLPHNSVEAVDNARDKHATRSVMEKAGLPTPLHYRIEQPEDVEKAGAHVGFPAVIKPVAGAASIGVIRVNDLEHLKAAYARVMSDMSKARIVAGALVEGVEGGEAGNAGGWIKTVLMLEEYLDGDEVDCDLIFDGGQPRYGAITDNWPTVEPYFNETGSNCPSILPREKQIELAELSVRSVQALGFTLGVFHVECKYTSRGPRLIEVNCRMGGGPVRDTNLLVWGVDLVEEHLMACAGIPVRPPVAKRPLKQMAEFTMNAMVSGILQNTDFLDALANRDDFLYARPLVKPGHKCVCVDDGLPTWIAELMVVKPTVREAIDFIQKAAASLQVPIVPAPAK
uniref:ATP-grasp domain-containing protein n=1 Tax=Chlamydomonas euryale TaxID=1486919 RepID=A0A7R9Z3D5_9CHLO|mmetsp:Transcript_41777/g.124959  ORF Transcript_41777/g.124959 Transcript_41777/m.124959 type:complete len:375 (+) Transcript_41777:224-1348(+)